MPNVDVWAGAAKATHDPDDHDVVTVDWAVKDGVEILAVDVVAGALVSVRLRVPTAAYERSVVPDA